MIEGKVENIDKIKGLCEKLVDSNMTVCPGIFVKEYESYKEVIRYDQKNMHITTDPIHPYCLGEMSYMVSHTKEHE